MSGAAARTGSFKYKRKINNILKRRKGDNGSYTKKTE